jgi:hypothetical protein
MNKILNLIYCFLLSIAVNKSYSQMVIDYSAWNSGQCNAFYPSATVNNITHTTTCGTIIYDNTNHAIELDTKAQNNIYKGTEYKLAFNFKQGYTYTIKINAWCNTPTYPVPNSKMRVDFSSASNSGGILCNGVELFNINYLTNNNNQQLTPGAYFDYTFQYNSLPVAQSYLYVGGVLQYINGTATSWILIKKVTVTETVPTPTFTIPSSVSIACGSVSSKTFTATNVYNSPGVTAYNWNLGSASNGWLYNGSPAPQTISTGTANSLTLTPVCGASQNSISATVIANGNNYTTNSSAVSVTPPPMSISGNSSLCSGTSTYSVSNVPCNATVTWSASPSGIINLSPSGATVTATTIGNGRVSLKATINACSNFFTYKDISVGTPQPAYGIYPMDGSNGYCVNGGQYGFEALGATGDPLGYKWIVYGPTQTDFYYNQADQIQLTFPGAGTNTVAFVATNSCGQAPAVITSVEVSGSCGGWGFVASPNPVSSSIEVALNNSTDKQMQIQQVVITDKMGNTIKTINNSGTKHLTINTGNLKPAMYFIRVFNGKEWKTKSIIKQ